MPDPVRTSHLPVMTPRSSNTSLPTLNFGLTPSSRYLSVRGSPTAATPTSSPTNGSHAPPAFRTIRNFFTGGKSVSGTYGASGIPKSPFSGLGGSLRRSMNVERSVSSPQLRVQPLAAEAPPVLSIELPHPGDEPLLKTPQSEAGSSPLAPSPRAQILSLCANGAVNEDLASSAAMVLGPTDLSTILESETSGISKHLPDLDKSLNSAGSDNASPSSFRPLDLPFLRAGSRSPDTRGRSSSPSHDTSALDLSTSKLSSEVFAAISESGDKDDWLKGVIVHDAPEDPAVPDHHELQLNALDPELAALLSPNRIAEPALLLAMDSIQPADESSPLPSPSSAAPYSATSSTHSIPLRKTLSPAGPSRPSTSTFSRVVRSVSDRTLFATPAKTTLSPPTARTGLARALSRSPERPNTASTAAPTRSMKADMQGSLRRPSTSGAEPRASLDSRPSAASRLMTPARSSTLNSSRNLSRPALRQMHSTGNAWESESASPSSRAPSSVGTAPSRLQYPRPSLDRARPSLDSSVRPARTGARTRSSSVAEARPPTAGSSYSPAPSRPTVELLGPRTAKAFAAAGLLDLDKSGAPTSASRPGSRFGTSRSSIDRDTPSRQTPSRAAFSEAESTSSWGARSRTVGTSDFTSHGGPLSESLSTPRTASTAPTSISSSSLQQHVQSEIQQLQERHNLESGALLNALADSQRTTKLLRDENTQLRDRLQQLEDRLSEALDRIQQLQYAPPPPPAPKPVVSRRLASPASSDRHSSSSHSRYQSSYLRPQSDLQEPFSDRGSETSESYIRPNRKRASGASSVFALLPSNMSMIMHEESIGAGSSGSRSLRSSPPSSPTMVFSRLNPVGAGSVPGTARPTHQPRHYANKSMSSTGNISPTTASFSIMTSSPGSLNLRPEHELHLGDMPILDLAAESLEEFEDEP